MTDERDTFEDAELGHRRVTTHTKSHNQSSLRNDGPAYLPPVPMAGETPDTFEAGEPARTEAQASIDQAREVAAKFVAGDTRSGHHPDVVKTREAKRALHLLGYDGDTEAELFEDIKRTAILGSEVSRELLRQDEADKRAMIGAPAKGSARPGHMELFGKACSQFGLRDPEIVGYVPRLELALIKRGHSDDCYSGTIEDCDCALAVLHTKPGPDGASALSRLIQAEDDERAKIGERR